MCDRVEQSKYEVLQKNIFSKCISTRSSRVSSSSSNSTLDEEVSISAVIEYLYQSYGDKYQKQFFEDIRKSLLRIAPNGHINWPLFKEGSRLWISSLQACKKQDGNNNIQSHENKENMYRYVSEWHSDDLMKDSISSGEESKSIPNEIDSEKEISPVRQSSLPFINVVNVSSYSPDSNSTRGLTDRSANSEIEMGYDAAIDLRLRIRKFDEENASLREEILRIEDVNITQHKQINSINRKLESLTIKNKNLQKELDEQKELLSEAEEREKCSKLELQKTLKENAILKNELESLQKHNESINALKNQVAHILQEKKKFQKQYDECEKAFNDKCVECDSLKDTIVELEDSHVNCRENYETSVQYLREKNQELLNQNLELQMKSNNSGSGQLSMTPPIGYINSYMHSTPYTATKVSPRRSLYAELKASGFSPERAKNDSKIAELEEELGLCNEELSTFSEQIENFIQELSVDGERPYVPILNLENENFNIPKLSILKQEVAVLMNLVKERVVKKSKTRDSCLQVDIEVPKVHRQFSGSIENESLALSESSMTSLSEINPESEKGNGCLSGAENLNIEKKSSQIQVQEDSVIKPIVEALDQIIKETVDEESSLQEEIFSTKNHKHKCIYTNTRPPTPSPDLIIPRELSVTKENAEFDCVMSKGDAPEINRMKNFNPLSQITTQPSTNISTVEIFPKFQEEEQANKKIDTTYCITPTLNLKPIPKRKLSVFKSPFDIDDSLNEGKMENRIQVGKNTNNQIINSQLNTYRSIVNSSESSDSASPDKLLCQFDDNSELERIERPKTVAGSIILAPSKLIFQPKISLDVAKELNLEFFENNSTSERKMIQSTNVESGKFRENLDSITNVNSGSVAINQFKENNSEIIGKNEEILEKDSKLKDNFNFSTVSVQGYQISNPYLHSLENNVANVDNSFVPVTTNNEEKTNIENRIGISHPMAKECSANGDNSGAVKSGNEIVNKITPSVVTAMSSAEDSSDSECDRINSKNDRQVAVSDSDSDIAKFHQLHHESPSKDAKHESEEEKENHDRQKLLWTHKRSLSDSENEKSRLTECQCHSKDITTTTPLQSLDKEKIYPKAFPSFTDDLLQESGIANYKDLQSELSESLSEDELEKKYTSFSVGLRTDRMTLSRRLTLSQRQRDQSERNLTAEVERMHQDIQDLAPLCTDRESLDRVEKVRLQLQMITQCAHRVSCVAETLGAVHQERRISRAAILADRYLQLLKSRYEKLSSEINETKRILMENNIFIEEHPSELGDDIPRIRYRAVPTNNRTMEGTRQRNSVSGRVTLRRPSLNYDTQKWDNDKLFRTDSSSSIGELREIFEQAESRRNSREENNNFIRNSSYLISTSCESAESEIWSHKEEDIPQESPPIEDFSLEQIQDRQTNFSRIRTMLKELMFHPIFWIWISFFLGIYVNHVFSSKVCVGAPYKWWSLEEMLESFIQIKSTGQRPI
ncbi:centromere-associated protein E-like isoform X2 [Leptopilina heterotoma]|uniref:centromere-associated protein E-like isoform X2 n=1 Tax=Leptopilina heterotoma TaxID=63436 RepID=UPI001CA906C0|nr:centromere-associated protein E-like isoform X2 [Leptopilina heterotoma]